MALYPSLSHFTRIYLFLAPLFSPQKLFSTNFPTRGAVKRPPCISVLTLHSNYYPCQAFQRHGPRGNERVLCYIMKTCGGVWTERLPQRGVGWLAPRANLVNTDSLSELPFCSNNKWSIRQCHTTSFHAFAFPGSNCAVIRQYDDALSYHHSLIYQRDKSFPLHIKR